jgi:hypothetical protein
MVINTTLGEGFASVDRWAQAKTEVATSRNAHRRRESMDKEDYTPAERCALPEGGNNYASLNGREALLSSAVLLLSCDPE